MDIGPIIVQLSDLQATERLGHALGRMAFRGAVIGLVGPLGAGKTFLVRAVAEGLGIANSRVVSSPTFVLIQEYTARLPIYHFDTYRLPSEQAFLDLGVQEYFAGDGVCLVEWADRVAASLPGEHLRIELEVLGETERSATLSAAGERWTEVMRQLRADLAPPSVQQ